jgi:signal transduction histidine kinase/CheY-like chemotaxis protein
VSVAVYATVALIGSRLIDGRNKATAALRASEAELRATLENVRASEETVRRAQKMEAVGQLAGGIAHDFNNLLTAILGNAELLRSTLDNATQRSDVDEIHRAALRAAELTGQLLTFARKQRVEARVMNLNDLVHRTDKMLRRIIGERIAVRTRCHVDLPSVRVDPGQIEQVLLNLAVNARDAMPDGGNLTIETDVVDLDEEYAREHPDARPGRYAVLAVSDTGTGIAEDVRSRIFEPFFTTKEVGKGTGLGLSICYGIVRQAGGHLSVYTEVGRGTTFRIYLPEVAAAAATPAATAKRPMPTGTETVLVVEDEEPVRKLLRRVLAGAGYTVLAAADGEEALRLLTASLHVPDLLVTDVVLPGRTGPEIAREVRQLVPDVAVLYISGYTERAAGNAVAIDAPFLAKPFTPELLAQRVREVLDARIPAPIRSYV